MDPDEWNDYDNLSDDEEEHEEDQDQEKEEISQAIDNYINKDREDSDKQIIKKSSESDEKEQTKEENTNFRSERHSYDHDINSNPEEVGFGVFKTDEFGNLQQIGFGQPKENKFAHFHSQNLEEDFPSRGWGQGFISAPHHPPVNGGFGSFLDQKPSPFAPPGFVPFGRGEGGRGFPRAGRPLPPQESLFKSNLQKGSSEVIRNYRHTVKTYFGPHLNTLNLKYVLGDSSKWPPSYGVWSYQETVKTQCCQSDVGHSGWKSSSSH